MRCSLVEYHRTSHITQNISGDTSDKICLWHCIYIRSWFLGEISHIHKIRDYLVQSPRIPSKVATTASQFGQNPNFRPTGAPVQLLPRRHLYVHTCIPSVKPEQLRRTHLLSQRLKCVVAVPKQVHTGNPREIRTPHAPHHLLGQVSTESSGVAEEWKQWYQRNVWMRKQSVSSCMWCSACARASTTEVSYKYGRHLESHHV